jgi:hypothetical protein
MRTFAGHEDAVTAVALSGDGRYALSGSADRTLKLWVLDWELEDRQPADWHEDARPYLETFLTLHTPHATEPAEARRRTVREIMHLPLSRLFKATPREEETGEARRGPPRYAEKDFQALLHVLGGAGFGWLRAEGIRTQLKEMVRQAKEAI